MRIIYNSLGLLVITIAAIFLYISLNIINHNSSQEYTIYAHFQSVNGLKIGDEVKLNGVNVGKVTEITLLPTYKVSVALTLNQPLNLPDDSLVKIDSTSLLGGSHIALVVGGSDTTIQPNGVLYNTLPAASLMDLLSKYLFSAK